MPATITQLGTNELIAAFRSNPVDVYSEAYRQGLNLSAWLERLNPSDASAGTDAYGRLLRAAGIVPVSDPVAGYWASPAIDFFESREGRALYPEFFARTWRRVSYGRRSQQRAVYLSDSGAAGSWQRPYIDAQTPRWDVQIAPAIPLSELVALTTPINGQDYRSFYLTYDAEALRKFRVGESAEIPITSLTDSERIIRLKKYGRGLSASYEQLRRMRVDKLAYQIELMAVQSEVDKVVAAIDVLVNGDGNAGTAPTTHDLTTLDAAATAGTMTLKGWLAFKLKFVNPYMLTTALMQEAVALQLILLDAGSANVPLMGLNLGGMTQSLAPINMTSDGVRYGWTADAPTLKIVGFDRRMALEEVVEIGGMVDEMERFITNQTQVMTMTEVHGFAIMDGNATEILDVNA